MCDPSATSKLNTGCDVPATPPTVTAEYPNRYLVLLVRHATEVDELHDDVPHSPASTAALAVCSPTPKLSPVTVTAVVVRVQDDTERREISLGDTQPLGIKPVKISTSEADDADDIVDRATQPLGVEDTPPAGPTMHSGVSEEPEPPPSRP